MSPLLPVFLILAATLSSVQGAENAEVFDLVRTLGSSDADDLAQRVEGLQPFDTIELSTTYIWLRQTLTVNASHVAIIGAPEGTKLRCPAQAGACVIKGTNVTLTRLEFVGCQGQVAVTVKHNRDENQQLGVSFNGVSFANNAQAGKGAAVVVEGCERPECWGPLYPISFRDCLFEGNRANRGGSALLLRSCDVTIRGTNFTNNKAEDGSGGAIWAQSSRLTIFNSQFIENMAHLEGGAISMSESESVLTVSNSVFEKNMAYNHESISLTEVAGKGGAVCMQGTGGFAFEGCRFQENKGVVGGTLFFEHIRESHESGAATQGKISSCKFVKNVASEVGNETEYSGEGGALYLSAIQGQVDITLSDSVFASNKATLGGAAHVISKRYLATIQIQEEECSFENNEAMSAGAVMIQGAGASFVLRDSEFINNKGDFGGALYARKDARLSVMAAAKGATVISNNSAVKGGGIMCEECRALLLASRVEFLSNVAREYGGAIFIADLRGVGDIGGSQFEGNVAAVGGAAAIRDSAHVRIKKGVDKEDAVFQNNIAITAGALFIRSEHLTSEIYEIENTKFIGNRAIAFRDDALKETIPALKRWFELWKEALQVSGSAEPHCEDCKGGRGGAVFFALRNVRDDSQVAFNLDQVTIADNIALIGGGGYIEGDRRNWGRVTSYKACLEAMTRPGSQACRGLDYRDVVVRNNRAKFAAGGLFLRSPKDLSALKLTTTSTEINITTPTTLGSHALVLLNYLEDAGSGYGANVATDARTLRLANVKGPLKGFASGDILKVKGIESETNSQFSDFGIHIEVKDLLNQTISAGAEDAVISVALESSWISGTREYSARHGLININETKVVGANITAEIVVKTEDEKTITTSLEFSTLPCQEGEIIDINQARCFRCKHDMYTFRGMEDCRACEKDALCAGTRALVPESGYWHSTPFSPIIKRCLLKKACSYEDRREALFAYYDDSVTAMRDLARFESENALNEMDWLENYPQCARGYRGTLCGSCAAGYGHLANKECHECSRSIRMTRFITVVTALLLFLVVTIRLGLAVDGLRKDVSFMQSEQKRDIGSRGVDPLPIQNPIGQEPAAAENDFRDGAVSVEKDTTENAVQAEAVPAGKDPSEDVVQAGAVPARKDPTENEPATESHEEEHKETVITVESDDREVQEAEEISVEEKQPPNPASTSEPHANGGAEDGESSANQDPESESLLSSQSDVSPESRNASGVLAETFNILFNYLQLNSVALKLDVNWSSASTFLSVQSSTARVSEAVPFDCNFDDRNHDVGMPNAIIVLWYTIAFPLMTIGVYLVLIQIYSFVRRETDKANYKFRFIPSATLVFLVVYLSYCIDIFSGLLRAARCVEFDSADDSSHPYTIYDTLTSRSAWVEDTAVTCWEGEHFWSAFVAAIGLVICCAVVVFIIIVLHKGRKAGKLKDPDFLLRYGFLYLKYRQEGMALYWESLITVRRMLLASIEVYAHYRVTTNSQIGLLAIIIFTFIALHEMIQPFDTTNFEDTFPSYAGSTLRFLGAPHLADRWVRFNKEINLNTLEGGSLFMSLSLFLAAMSINGEEGDVAESKLLLSVCLLLNALFFLFMLHRLWFGIHHSLDVAADVRNLSFRNRVQTSDEEHNKTLAEKAWRMLREKIREW